MKFCGSAFRVSILTDSGFQELSSQSDVFAINAESVEVTTKEDAWRRLLDGCGTLSASVTIVGFMTDGALFQDIRSNLLNREHEWFRISSNENQTVYISKFKVTGLERIAEYNGAEIISLTLDSDDQELDTDPPTNPDPDDLLFYLSTRLVNPSYTGPCMRVRRASDNSESDIGFSSGWLDQSGLESFCAGGEGFVAKWYNQWGHTDFIQDNAATQPSIVDSSGDMITSGGLPALYGSADRSMYGEDGAYRLQYAFITFVWQPIDLRDHSVFGAPSAGRQYQIKFDSSHGRETDLVLLNGGTTRAYADPAWTADERSQHASAVDVFGDGVNSAGEGFFKNGAQLATTFKPSSWSYPAIPRIMRGENNRMHGYLHEMLCVHSPQDYGYDLEKMRLVGAEQAAAFGV